MQANNDETLAVKIRVQDNSIRLRLTRSEVDAMRETGAVKSHTGFPGGRRLSYALESSPASVKSAAYYSDNEIRVSLPETAVLAWATTDQVSIGGEQILDSGETLTILVEKDFACLAPRPGEDEADMFPHPEADKGSC
ncbi:MAG: hypothetical protein HQ492_02615 [Woeseiaceae bacterium]|nr:hypothetical protein [Woeseiaceae bacterium]